MTQKAINLNKSPQNSNKFLTIYEGEIQMKKYLIILLVVAFVASMTLMGIGCKEEAPAEEEAVEEAPAEEEAVEEVEEAPTISLAEDPNPFDVGGEVVVGMLDFPLFNPVLPIAERFTEETGIVVRVEQYPSSAYVDKMNLEMASGTSDWDIVYLSPSWKGLFIANDYIIPLNEYIEKYNVDLSGFSPAALGFAYYEGGDEIWGYPLIVEQNFMVYRKDLFDDPQNKADFKEKYGYDLKYPDNVSTDEILEMAEFFTKDLDNDGIIDQYGIARHQFGANWPWVWTLHLLYSFGATLYTEDYHANLNTPEAVAAMEYGKKLQEFMPPAVMQWEFAGLNEAMWDGTVVMAITSLENALYTLDPEKTEFAGKFGAGLVPHAPDKEYGKWINGGGASAVTKVSDNPEGAFLFLNYVFNDDARAVELALGGGPILRSVVYEDPAVMAKFPEGADEFIDADTRSAMYVGFERPVIPVNTKLFAELSVMWPEIALGEKTIEQALFNANDNMEAILEEMRE